MLIINHNNKSLLFKITCFLVLINLLYSSTAFGETYHANNFKSLQSSMVKGIKKQSTEIILHYNNEEELYTSTNEAKQLAEKIFLESYHSLDKSILGKNLYKANYYITKKNNNSLSIRYLITYKNTKKDLDEAEKTINNFIKENIKEDMTDSEKIRVIYNFIIDKYSYGFAEGDNKNLKERNILLGLQGEPVVCEAYAMLFSLMANKLGYKTMIITGTIGENNTETHAWNLVEIDGEWYHIDATWGDSYSKDIRDKYFLTSDFALKYGETFPERRMWDEEKYPPAPNVYNYNKEKKSKEEYIREKTVELENDVKRLKTKFIEVDKSFDSSIIIKKITEVEELKKQVFLYELGVELVFKLGEIEMELKELIAGNL